MFEVRGELSVLRGCTCLVWRAERTSAVGREGPHHPAAPCSVNSAVGAIVPSEHLSPVLGLVLSPHLPPRLDHKPCVRPGGAARGRMLGFSVPRLGSTRPRTQSGLRPKWRTPTVVRPAMAFPSQPRRVSPCCPRAPGSGNPGSRGEEGRARGLLGLGPHPSEEASGRERGTEQLGRQTRSGFCPGAGAPRAVRPTVGLAPHSCRTAETASGRAEWP